MRAAQNPHTFIGARYRRIASRHGPQRANVAVQHTLLTAIWHMGITGTLYENCCSRLNPERTRSRAIRQLEAMGYRVTLDHAS